MFENVDVVVVGAGHAGIEAAVVCSKLNKKTLLLTLSLDKIANMPCNPSIGGTAKGHLVRELDALGGVMGKIADITTIQSKILNQKRGPAVRSLRAQIDRVEYSKQMKHLLETQENLFLFQDEAVEIEVKNNKVFGVKTQLGLFIKTKAVILACGTFLNAKTFVGNNFFLNGPDKMPASLKLSSCLKNLDVPLRRFKTGTPARVNKKSLNLNLLEIEKGDEKTHCFSFSNTTKIKNKVVCYKAYTNQKTHEIILKNLKKSPLYSGEIVGVGPRYCPSIEDKIVRFKDKQRHPIFVEPVGLNSKEMYLQGMSSSLPLDVQLMFLKTIKGFEDVQIMRPAYAIEYDCVDPTFLYKTLEFKTIGGLYGAGQFNGTSGYEEAAVQGFVAGVNAALKIDGLEEFVLKRSSSYIGTLIDDLVTKGCTEPYRIMTARSEFRLILRHDNADKRLCEIGYKLKTLPYKQYLKFCKKQKQIELEKRRLEKINISPTKELNKTLKSLNTTPIEKTQKLLSLVKRPQISLEAILKYLNKQQQKISVKFEEEIEIGLKYEEFIEK